MNPLAAPCWAATLSDLGLIEASGADAVNFLQSQLTNDIKGLAADKAQLSGYCTAKGRLLATFVTWKTDGTVRLLVNREIQPAVQKRLGMFVLRAKVVLNDATDSRVILGMGGSGAAALLKEIFGCLPDADYGTAQTETGTLIHLPAASGAPRWLLIVDQAFVQRHGAHWQSVTLEAWWWTQIQTGIPQIVTATQEKFVPQMVNFDAVGGVSFSKGCYPGQEIVARSHYLGKLKRRMALAHADAEGLQPGMDVFHAAAPCGLIVNVAPHPAGGSDLLVELPIEAQEQGKVRVLNSDGPVLNFLPLPYPLPAK